MKHIFVTVAVSWIIFFVVQKGQSALWTSLCIALASTWKR